MRRSFHHFKLGCVILFAVLKPRLLGADPLPNFAFEEFKLAPIRIHLLLAPVYPQLQTTLGTNEIRRIFSKVNRIWAQAGLHFFIESIACEDANHPEAFDSTVATNGLRGLLPLRPAGSRSERCFHVYLIREMPVNGVCLPEAIFVKEMASLRAVEHGIDEPLPRVISHELGHALGLVHRQNRTNLMASGTTGIALNTDEISTSRFAAAKLDWILSGPVALALANQLYSLGRKVEAQSFYHELATLPVTDLSIDRVRHRLVE